jgi:CubicO group peptidase (beta-lactamase class C family)
MDTRNGSDGWPSAADSDPAALGWMVGSPPPEDRIVRFDDGSFHLFPAWRWSVSNFRRLMPTVAVSRGLEPARALPPSFDEGIDDVTFTPWGSDLPMSWGESLAVNYTDGIVVLHRGEIAYERYFGVLTESGQHGAMSMTKSLVGLLGAILVAEGVVDDERPVTDYVPELASAAFGDATVRQVLDMTTALQFSEDYSDPAAEIWAHAGAGNPLPKPADYAGPRNYYEYLVTVEKQGTHGAAFGYKTVNTDALGWVLARVTGMSVAELLSERIWTRVGAEQDGYFSVDSIGVPFAGGGFSCGLRDLARVGQLMLSDGPIDGRRIVPEEAIDDIRRGGDPDLFARGAYGHLSGWSYRNMWWITHNPHGAFMARGVHGQALYVDPLAEMVIARFASHPVAGNAASDPTSLPAFAALGRYLAGST